MLSHDNFSIFQQPVRVAGSQGTDDHWFCTPSQESCTCTNDGYLLSLMCNLLIISYASRLMAITVSDLACDTHTLYIKSTGYLLSFEVAGVL